MAPQELPRRYALLVGVNFYQSDGSRKDRFGNTLPVQHLKGCVNDMERVREFITSNFHMTQLWTLSSSSHDGRVPDEGSEKLPTYTNVQKHIELVRESAKPGDIFLFYFAGHGSRLPRIKESPAGRDLDPSLITADYHCGKRAIRGWQLNKWLRKLDEKGIQVAVILDSCHSGGAWRTGQTPRFQDFSNITNLKEDEDGTDEPAEETKHRDSSIGWSWSINPERLTLMAACASDHVTSEDYFGDSRYGVYTYELLKSLEIHGVGSTYRIIHESTATRLAPSLPELYGRADLMFFGNKVSTSSHPIVAVTDGTDIVIPIGLAHAAYVESELVAYSDHSAPITIHSTYKFSCRAKIPASFNLSPGDTLYVIPRKWSTGREQLVVRIQEDLGTKFRHLFQKALYCRLKGQIKVLPSRVATNTDGLFEVKADRNKRITIHGPADVVGYAESVRGLSIPAGDVARRAIDSAVAISHLYRFSQIYRLEGSATISPPFRVEHLLGSSEVRFENLSDFPLYVALVNLAPSFAVSHIWPQDRYHRLEPGALPITLPIGLEVPDQLRFRSSGKKEEHRDIVRFFFTNCEGFSFKGVELPDIWDAENSTSMSSVVRGVIIPTNSRTLPQFWVKDITICHRA